MGEPLPTLTPGKLAWLEKLQREGTASRARGNVGRNCMVNGWTDWACRAPDGSLVPWRSLTWEQRQEHDYETVGEMLTESGLQKLNDRRGHSND